MKEVTLHSRAYRDKGIVRLEIDTTQGGISAWTKDFPDANEILTLFLRLAPGETAKIRDFVTRTVSFGEGHVIIECEEKNFSTFGFEKLPSA